MSDSNIPNFKVTLNGKDLSPKIRPRLVSLTITEKREDADQIDLSIDDSDSLVDLPTKGQTIAVSIGWLKGPDVTPGLISKGSFIIDEIGHAGPPDLITIRGRAADFTKASDLRKRREKGWKHITLGSLVTQIAGRHGLTPHTSATYASVVVDAVHQSRESDLALLKRLGREHDALATIKAGKLIFAPIGTGKTATGKTVPAFTFRRGAGDTHTYSYQGREEVTGVTASYHDRDEGTKVKISVGVEAGAKHLSRVYASESSAKRAAKAAMSRAGRAAATMDIKAALGRADVYPDRRVAVAGFKKQIDATAWVISEVTHSIQSDGFTTAMKLETIS